MIKVIITDDHPVVRLGIRQILEDDESIGLIDEASEGKELITKLMKQDYNVVLLDITLPGRSGMDLISQVKKFQPSAAVLMLSIYSEEMYAMTALKYGASGYLTKSSAPEELIAAIHKVSRGERFISASLAEKLADNILANSYEKQRPLLSPREMDVLSHFAAGKTVIQIASEFSLSPKTISTYRTRLLTKLKLKTTSDLIRYAIVMEGEKKA
jgi:two-component system invasion response regulator UvrY